ncbi:CLUMA_CG004651, isoform A [Clunio marinus]|uniref:CLUMA_CG004651, isoform A n=1 Tax=Clunio marinus TaxID=568069 RepID=A0A1J1HTS6_9DIPT|nr:CLUMA_CG004651, isoform A [Clunio marinus]
MNLKFLLLQLVLICAASAYEIIIEKLEQVPGKDGDVTKLKSFELKNFNESTKTLNGVMELLEDIGEEFDAEGTAYNFADGKYNKIVSKKITNVCTLYEYKNETLKESYEDIENFITPRVAWKTCPYPKGVYELKDYVCEDKRNLLPKTIPGGENWKVELRMKRKEQDVGGYDAYITVRKD